MVRSKTKGTPSASFRAFLDKQLKDPKFRQAYDDLEPEFEIVQQIIDLRQKQNVSQSELARRMGAPQPSIARLERRGKTKDLEYLQRVAKALDAKLEVRLVPREASGKRGSRRRVKRV
jgi:ribosome-binding protein aMBF1 (putative translation factor)